MIYFNPNKPLAVRAEASHHDGLSAGLFQDIDKGLQPVHFISRTMTETETEKDTLAVMWAKNRFRMYLLGAPTFRIITGHKPSLSMFNKVTAKLPPRTERWVKDISPSLFFFKKCLDNKAKPDDWREITMHKARTRKTREHENNMITDDVPNEEHGVEPEEAESLLRRPQRIRR